MMRFLVDEGADALIVHTLRRLGHDVLYIAETASGSKDIDILAQAVATDRIIISED